MESMINNDLLQGILINYGFEEEIVRSQAYIHKVKQNRWVKLIHGVTLKDGRRLVIKIVREDDDFSQEQKKVENQSNFSEIMRKNGINTPIRYQTGGRYTMEIPYEGIMCLTTVEDWCGEEIKEINGELANNIGKLMARMHILSLENKCVIGEGTLFSAAYTNDVDSFSDFCRIAEDPMLDQSVISQIKSMREEKLHRIRLVWETLPKSAVQGDISINNLAYAGDGVIVFDYNNAGDEVLVSDLVLEGLLTAYEMDLPGGTPESYREQLFPSLLKGYLSVRALNEAERAVAWEVYTLYHGLWFSRIVFNDDSLDSLVKMGNYEAANLLLNRMLEDMREVDDGRFQG